MTHDDPEIRAALREVLTDAGAEIWLHRPNRLLGGDTPAERCKADGCPSKPIYRAGVNVR